ncbi:MAG: hypothetical protein OEW71_05385 [Candidatus Bathyarchaeota archaeon]|nr:hypothetical protein [Candidatus Bathyarchaeota archaeon]MDH5734001.1 hypothetical protein [Candidatus Bathyarchaeota archaeon]
MGDDYWVYRKRVILEGPRKGEIVTEKLLPEQVRAEDRHIERLSEIESRYSGRTDFRSELRKNTEIFRGNMNYFTISIRLSDENTRRQMRQFQESLRKARNKSRYY